MSFSSLRISMYVLLGSLVVSFLGSQVWALTMVDTSYVDFQANNCTIPAGKSTCPSTLYVTTYAWRTFNVSNLNRSITTSNLLNPNNYTTIPGTTNSAYTVGANTITGDAANYISYGDSNSLNLFEGTRLIARAIASAKCATGTIWNGQICSTPGTPSPIACSTEARMCANGSVMPRNMNTCDWLPAQCGDAIPTSTPTWTGSSLSISCTKSTYFLGEPISCKIRWGTSIKTCWQTGKSAVVEKNCVDYRWIPDANGIDLSYNGVVTSAVLGSYNLYVRDAAGKSTFTQVRYSDDRAEDPVKMDVKSCTIESGKSRCPATVDVTAPAGKLFNLENIQRGTTSTNIIRPGVYTITTSFLWDDAANYITYGVNDLVLKEWTLPVARASTNAVCAINTRWIGDVCAAATTTPPVITPTVASKVNMKTGNGAVVFSDDLYKNISKNSYYPEQVTKNITISSTTSVLNLTLSSPKAQCAVSPSYKTDAGLTFSNNWKIINNSDLPSFDMSLPVYSSASQIWATIYGKISTLTISCETSTESTKDLLIYNIVFGTVSPAPYIDFQANNCTIPVGKSTCASTLYVTAPSGKYYTLRNFTRSLTTSNLLTPNNYTTIPGSNNPAYTIGANIITGDAANYGTNGVNDLALYEDSSAAGTAIAKATMTATCATGSTWNGQICATVTVSPPTNPPYTDFQANNCIIPAGKSTCPSSLFVRAAAGKYFDVTNLTRWLTTSNLLNPTNYINVIGSSTPMYTVSVHITGDAANYLKYGVNDLTLKEWSTVIAKAVATAECVKGTIWNGQACTTWAVACTDVVRFCEDGSAMPRDANCGWLPGQCGGKIAEPLVISCSKSTYSIWEAISCKISGWIGSKSCWQLGTKSTEPIACTNLGWNEDGGSLYYSSSVSASMLGEYALYTKDSQWTIATTKVSYIAQSPTTPPTSYIDFQANNCTISAGQSKCASTLYVKAPAGKYYSVSNLNRGITTSNLLNPKNYMSIAGSSSPMYSVGVSSSWDAANYITYGESNTLTLLEGDNVVARAIASAKCMTGSTWNGIACSGWWGSSTEPSPVCSKVWRECSDGTLMPRNPKTCEWLPNQCSTDPIDLYPIDPLPPIKPYGNPTVQVLSIAWIPVSTNNYVEISKSPTAPLSLEWEITSIRSGYTVKLTSNKSDFFITMPVNNDWVWSTAKSPTDDIYKSRIVVEWDNLLTFSLIDDATKKSVAQTFVKVKVKFVRGGIIAIPPNCMMADGTKWSCTNPPTIPTYPNCPKSGTSKVATMNSLIYCPTDDAIEINPTNTINPKSPIRWSGGIIAIPPTCMMADGTKWSCTNPPTYPNCPKPGTSQSKMASSDLIYCPTDDTIEMNPTNTINPKPPTRTKPPTRWIGVIVPIEDPTLPPCSSSAGNSLTIGCTNSIDVVIVDGIPSSPAEEALDAASRKRIDTIIARTRSRVADMPMSAGVAFVDTSIKRIQWLPNKTAKAKLIDAYTLSRLQSLRNALKSSAGWTEDDYIGLVDTVLSN